MKRVRQGLLGALKWSYIANAFNGVSQLFLVMVLARILEPEDFGVYGILLSVVGLCALVLTLGAEATVIQRPGLTKRQVALVSTVCAATSAIGAIGMIAAGPALARYFDTPELVPVLMVGAPILILTVFNSVRFGLVRRAMDFRWLAIVNCLTFVLAFAPVALALAVAGAGMWSLVGAYGAETIVRSIALLLRRDADHLSAEDHGSDDGLFSYGLKTSLFNALNSAENAFLNFFILRAFGLTTLGIFNRINRMREIIQDKLGMSAASAIFSHFAFVFGNRGDLQREFRLSVSLINAAMLPIFTGAALNADIIVSVVLGENFVSGSVWMSWLFLAVPVIVNQALLSNVVVATGRVGPSIFTQAAFLISFVSLAILFSLRTVEQLLFLYVSLIFGRYFIYSLTALRATRLGAASFIRLHLLGGWSSVIVCGVLYGAHQLLSDTPPAVSLPILLLVGSLAMLSSLVVAPVAIFEPALVQTAVNAAERRLRPLHRFLVFRFRDTEALAVT